MGSDRSDGAVYDKKGSGVESDEISLGYSIRFAQAWIMVQVESAVSDWISFIIIWIWWIEERPTVITLVSQFPAILITISTYTLTSLMSTLPMRHSISVKMTKMSQIWSEAIFHYYVIWVKMMATFTPKWYSIICYQIHYEDQLFNLAPLLSSFATFPPPFLN